MKIIRKAGLIILVVISIFMAAILFWREDVPEGRAGTLAEILADSMATAMGQEAWDKTAWISWTVNDDRK